MLSRMSCARLAAEALRHLPRHGVDAAKEAYLLYFQSVTPPIWRPSFMVAQMPC